MSKSEHSKDVDFLMWCLEGQAQIKNLHLRDRNIKNDDLYDHKRQFDSEEDVTDRKQHTADLDEREELSVVSDENDRSQNDGHELIDHADTREEFDEGVTQKILSQENEYVEDLDRVEVNSYSNSEIELSSKHLSSREACAKTTFDNIIKSAGFQSGNKRNYNPEDSIGLVPDGKVSKERSRLNEKQIVETDDYSGFGLGLFENAEPEIGIDQVGDFEDENFNDVGFFFDEEDEKEGIKYENEGYFLRDSLGYDEIVSRAVDDVLSKAQWVFSEANKLRARKKIEAIFFGLKRSGVTIRKNTILKVFGICPNGFEALVVASKIREEYFVIYEQVPSWRKCKQIVDLYESVPEPEEVLAILKIAEELASELFERRVWRKKVVYWRRSEDGRKFCFPMDGIDFILKFYDLKPEPVSLEDWLSLESWPSLCSVQEFRENPYLKESI